MSGWIQLHRKLLDNPIFKNHKLLQTFLYCLLKASHKEHDVLIGEAIVRLKKGQLATGRKAISAATGLTEQNVRTSLSKLETLSILTINPTTKYSIISISNWESYQQTNQQVTSNQPTSNQQVTTNNNVNNENNENKLSELFDKFYSAYPVKKSKEKAKKAFMKLRPTEEFTDMLIADVTKRLLKDQAWRDKQYIKHPSTYLNNKSWTDEIDVVSLSGAFQSNSQQYAQPIRKPMPIPGRTA